MLKTQTDKIKKGVLVIEAKFDYSKIPMLEIQT